MKTLKALLIGTRETCTLDGSYPQLRQLRVRNSKEFAGSTPWPIKYTSRKGIQEVWRHCVAIWRVSIVFITLMQKH